MSLTKKKKEWVPGSIIKVPIEDDWHVYGRLLSRSPFYAFYDSYVQEDQHDMNAIVRRNTLFIICVYDYVIRKSLWPIVGHVPLKHNEETIPPRFIQDGFPPYNCSILEADGQGRSATIEECRGLERASVWEHEHVISRVTDHYAGRPNVWVELLKLIE